MANKRARSMRGVLVLDLIAVVISIVGVVVIVSSSLTLGVILVVIGAAVFAARFALLGRAAGPDHSHQHR